MSSTELRARFAARLSDLYGTEVPAYQTLVEASHEVNQRVLARSGAAAERLGSIERVTAERHGAIRVGTPRELAEVARVFGALGMYPCGFYDLRDAAPAPVPVVSTAFRPRERDELAANPFRVFTSLLVPEDRRFFRPGLEQRLKDSLDARELFPAELLALSDIALQHAELAVDDANRFLDLAVESFALSQEPVDRAWYAELGRVSAVAADIGGVSTTHLNHLTPRVLDIDDLYVSMQARGIAMIDEIQGPPRWDGPDVLLRQTSFRALAEPRFFRGPDGTISPGTLRVRFGEVEARGIALTQLGRERFDELVGRVDRLLSENPGLSRSNVAQQVWSAGLPATERGLCLQGLGFFTYRVDRWVASGRATARQAAALEVGEVPGLVEAGVLHPEPIVYEDFLPRSAAGIFASNLADQSSVDQSQGGAERDLGWMSDVIGAAVAVPADLYAQEASASLRGAEVTLGRRIRSEPHRAAARSSPGPHDGRVI